MLSQKIAEDYADVLLWGLFTARSRPFKNNDLILVRFDWDGLVVAEALQKKILEQGMNPVVRLLSTAVMERQFYELAGDKQLVHIAPGDEELYRNLNGNIALLAPQSLRHLSHIDPSRMARFAVSRKKFRDIMDERESDGRFGWSLGMVPTQALAREAGMSFPAYFRQWAGACYLDREDPVGRWKETYARAQKIKAWLNGLDIEKLHVESKSCDLWVHLGRQRKWIGISGHNIPSFEIFLSPDFRHTSGIYYADQPSYRLGNQVSGVRLEFTKGVVTKVSADQGEDFVKKQLAMDKGASRVGEFSLTDRRLSPISRFMANTLFDENFGGKQGNCHLAVGSSYADTFAGDPSELTPKKKQSLGFNDSALHWDLVNTERKTVEATLLSGEHLVIYKDGEFTLP
ncbi:MAG: aminopeptidase [Thermodesulfobacteriota bacterium]